MAKKVEKFSDKLRQCRESAGLSMYALAKISGVSTQAMSSLESGINQPTWETVQRLAAALGVTADAFATPVALPASEPARGRGRPRKVNVVS